MSAFNQSLTGQEPAGELPLYASSVIPMRSIATRTRSGERVTLRLPVSTSATQTSRPQTSPTLLLDCQPGSCAGVYPLEVAIVDIANKAKKPVASFTTHLCYLANQKGSLHLHVALVLPLGNTVAPNGAGQSVVGPVGA